MPVVTADGSLVPQAARRCHAKGRMEYVRYMDDWVIITPTRWKLRKAVRLVNQVLNDLQVEQHPDKTFIGRAERGFDFLGYFMKPGSLTVAATTAGKMQERIARLYEQGADDDSIGEYVKRWWVWARSGLDDWKEEIKRTGAIVTLPLRNAGIFTGLCIFPSKASTCPGNAS